MIHWIIKNKPTSGNAFDLIIYQLHLILLLLVPKRFNLLLCSSLEKRECQSLLSLILTNQIISSKKNRTDKPKIRRSKDTKSKSSESVIDLINLLIYKRMKTEINRSRYFSLLFFFLKKKKIMERVMKWYAFQGDQRLSKSCL